MAPRYDGAMSPRGPHRLFFDPWSLVYDAPGVQRVTYRPVQDALVRALRVDPPARILDVGCGRGGSGCGSRASFLEPT